MHLFLIKKTAQDFIVYNFYDSAIFHKKIAFKRHFWLVLTLKTASWGGVTFVVFCRVQLVGYFRSL